MGKLLEINRCTDCRHRHTYKTTRNYLRPVCEKAVKDIVNIEEIPEWCPLQSNDRTLYYQCPKCADHYPIDNTGCYICDHDD